jgi:hypothetical protein
MSALERSCVVLLKVQIPKAKLEGFQNTSMHVTETSTGAQLVMLVVNYAGFQSQFPRHVDGVEKFQICLE